MTALLEKSFDISKQQVWDAFRQVRRNKGAPGVDEVSLAEFEEDLGDNLALRHVPGFTGSDP